MGICGHTIQFKPDLYKATGRLVRDYHPVEWDLGGDSRNYPPFPKARNGVDWQQTYGSWQKAGYDIDVCLMFESVPTNQWHALGADAFAYGFSFARAFGPASTSPLAQAVEIGNEPGKVNDADYRTVFENMARAIRQADPGLRIATCAVTAGKSHAYAKSLTCFDGLTNLFDAITLHTYAMLENWPTWRRSFPEDPKLTNYLKDIRDVCAWRDLHAPSKPVWVTEFGYDASTKKPASTGDFKDWVGCTETQQAQWLVRSWLTFATLPIDRAYVYFFNDNDTPQLHGSSGLTRDFKPKPAFHAVAHLYRSLGDYRFSKIVRNEPGRLMIYEFEHAQKPAERLWVVWSPTGTDRTEKMPLPQPASQWLRAERMPLTADSAPLPLTELSTVEITESPLYLWWKG